MLHAASGGGTEMAPDRQQNEPVMRLQQAFSMDDRDVRPVRCFDRPVMRRLPFGRPS